MLRLHETIDHTTGEVYHIETTRQAKRRYQRNGQAQNKPTIGQINAADLWNKQEEKIRKDREREERRKKNKAKQDAKDARQRDLQQDMLRKGRITLEDTWGKVNPSQNRLHRFFGAGLPCPGGRSAQNDRAEQISVLTERGQADHVVADESNQHQPEPNVSFIESVDESLTGSPLSLKDQESLTHLDPACINGSTASETPDTVLLTKPPSVPPSKRKLSSVPDLMPPPKRPATMADNTRMVGCAYLDLSKMQGPCPTSLQLPLNKTLQSEASVRALEEPCLCTKAEDQSDHNIEITQIVEDTLSGLCTQDLADDLTDDEKENISSLQTVSMKPECSTVVHTTPDLAIQIQSFNSHDLDDGYESIFDDISDDFSGSDRFDDEGIDDDSLLSMAATQHLKHDLFISARHRQLLYQSQTSTSDRLDGCRNRPHQTVSVTSDPKLSDSFTMDGLNDNDLLQGLEDFESNIQTSVLADSDHRRDMDHSIQKKRRNLPWIRNPDRYDIVAESNDGGFPPSSLSPSFDT